MKEDEKKKTKIVKRKFRSFFLCVQHDQDDGPSRNEVDGGNRRKDISKV